MGQERDRLVDGPRGALRAALGRERGVPGCVVGEPTALDGVGQRGGQHRDAATDRRGAPAGRLQVGDELRDVPVVEVLEPVRSERGHEVVADVALVAEQRLGLELVPHPVQPLGEVRGDGLAVVDLDPGPAALNDVVEGSLGAGLRGEPSAAHRLTVAVDGGQVDGVGPAAVLRAGGQIRAAGSELAAVLAAARARSVDAAAAHVGSSGWSSLADGPSSPSRPWKIGCSSIRA